ncbi:hypothetical protein ACFSJW_13370 [Flavobacterium artemisiae]|uniref:Uncharacterized protein n=1 Tax=Flavobacterium artemisiae TaxID=2126556 RepID=A0ABW4HFP2_9FLAO
MRIYNENHTGQVRISEDSPLYMENYERKHVERYYQSTSEELLCWGEEPKYIDSEFSNTFERKDQGNRLSL